LQKSRNNALRAWTELQNIYQQMHPEAKAETHMSISQIASKYAKLRDIAKEVRQQQKTVEVPKDPLNETLESIYESTTKKALAQNYMKRGRGQGGGKSDGSP
jgi:hypothetical protein